MPILTVNGRRMPARRGEVLSTVLTREGIYTPHPCGGRGVCQKCTVVVDGVPRLSCQYVVTHDVSVTLSEPAPAVSLSSAPDADEWPENFCYVLDLGTTTLALAALSPEDGRVLRTVAAANPQTAFGADVMSRITYCRHHGVAPLQRPLIECINALLRQLGGRHAPVLYVAGNTTMLHLLLGVDCSSMGVAPWTPAFTEERRVEARALGVRGVDFVHTLPCLSAFVGADALAGINRVGVSPAGGYRLLIDLGTNAEMLLFSNTKLFYTSAAAGPCFEGGIISCGMSATVGAIDSYADGRYHTVGDAPAAGLCGTGLIDVIEDLVRRGIIDEAGHLEGAAFVIAPGVTLTQEDVHQYQLAKSAVCAAVLALLDEAGVRPEQLEQVFLAGGFSLGFNVQKAIQTGLLPAAFTDKCLSCGNTSLKGAVRFACGQTEWAPLMKGARHVDLTTHPRFSERYFSGMSLCPCKE